MKVPADGYLLAVPHMVCVWQGGRRRGGRETEKQRPLVCLSRTPVLPYPPSIPCRDNLIYLNYLRKGPCPSIATRRAGVQHRNGWGTNVQFWHLPSPQLFSLTFSLEGPLCVFVEKARAEVSFWSLISLRITRNYSIIAA